ncbi:MAG: c-type cytochrome [Verrucomicrobia bacterium]|nr:c-type cytochrome [Verrucomicrobiota bacterium]MBV9643133.1 c-type cytochrome [Verrucomicrobiota bacterium]
MLLRLRIPGLLLLSALIFGNCSKPPEEPRPTHEESTSHTGEIIFQTRCFVCHGREGKGDGPASTGLGATVRDLTSRSWQDSTSDETIRSVIRNGAQAVGGSAAMPPNRDLSDLQIQSLVRYIHALRK